MKKLLLLSVLILVAGCNGKPTEEPKASPSDIAKWATKMAFDLDVHVQENTKDHNSKIKQFTTTFQDNTCDVEVDSTTSKVVKMSCSKAKTKPSSAEGMLTDTGKEAAQELLKKQGLERLSSGY